MNPGVYDISNAQYHSSEGISRSGISLLKKSPLHYWDKYLNPERAPEKETRAKNIGNAFHKYTLEKDDFFNDFVIAPTINKRTSAGKQQWEEFVSNAGEKQILLSEEFNLVESLTNAINAHPEAKNLVDGAQYEKSFYWVDDDTGVLCKCRLDIWHANMIVDLKTAEDASRYEFQRALARYDYHIQAAMYLDGVRKISGASHDNFIFIVIEKEPPHAIGIYVIESDAIEKGRQIYKQHLALLKSCQEANHWPTYSIQPINLPAYAY